MFGGILLLALLSFSNVTGKLFFNNVSVDLGVDKDVELPKKAIVTSVVINFGVTNKGEVDTSAQNILVNYIEATTTKNEKFIYSYEPKTIVIYNSDSTGYNMAKWTKEIGNFIESESAKVIKINYNL